LRRGVSLSGLSREELMTGNAATSLDPRRPRINHLSKLCWSLEKKVFADPTLSDMRETVKRMRDLLEELLDESSLASAEHRQ
jgi:hypothetical protein